MSLYVGCHRGMDCIVGKLSTCINVLTTILYIFCGVSVGIFYWHQFDLYITKYSVIPIIMHNEYKKVFFLRYCVMSSRSLALIPWFIINRCKTPVAITWNMLWSGTVFNAISFCSGYFWYLSLTAAPAAIVNSVYEFSVAICYIFSVLFLPNYQMTWFKNLSVTICLLGVTLIGYGTYDNESDSAHSNGTSDELESGTSWHGIVWCLISTVAFGIMKPIFTLFNNRYFPKLPPVQSALFMQGFNGILIVFTLWPGFILLHFTGIEPFELPTEKEDIFGILIYVAVCCAV